MFMNLARGHLLSGPLGNPEDLFVCFSLLQTQHNSQR